MPSHNASRMAELVWALASLRAGFRFPGTSASSDLRQRGLLRSSSSSGMVAGHRPVISEALAQVLMKRTKGRQSHSHRSSGGTFNPYSDPQDGVKRDVAGPGPGSQRQQAAGLARAGLNDICNPLSPGPGSTNPTHSDLHLVEKVPSPLLWSEVRRCTHFALVTERNHLLCHRAADPLGVENGVTRGRGNLKLRSQLDVQGLTRLSLGLAMASQADPDMVFLIEDVALSLPPGDWPASGSGTISDMASALARLETPAPKLMAVLCKSFTAVLRQGCGAVPFGNTRGNNTRDVTSRISAELYSAAADLSNLWPSEDGGFTFSPVRHPRPPMVSPLHVSKMMWATSALGHKDTDLLYAVSALIQDANPM